MARPRDASIAAEEVDSVASGGVRKCARNRSCEEDEPVRKLEGVLGRGGGRLPVVALSDLRGTSDMNRLGLPDRRA